MIDINNTHTPVNPYRLYIHNNVIIHMDIYVMSSIPDNINRLNIKVNIFECPVKNSNNKIVFDRLSIINN